MEYFRVRLATGGTLQVSGTISKAYAWAYNWMRVLVYDTPASSPATILQAQVSGGSSPKFVQSSVYTNTSGAPKEVYLVVTGLPGYNSVEDVVLTVQATEGPRLTMWLDADGNFNTAAPSSDHQTYLPGAQPSTGLSVPLPQSLQLIAAYTNAAGAIVAPPPYASASISFGLSETTSWVGYAMNAGADTGPDFALGGSSATFSGDHTARMTLQCLDYGGSTLATASDVSATATLALPLDTDGNQLPDAGWSEGRLAYQQPDFVAIAVAAVTDSGTSSDDDDSVPSGNGVPGDNSLSFEEYRGFVLFGTHVRSNPALKDAFLYAYRSPAPLDDAIGTGLVWRQLFQSELSAGRVVNFNHSGTPGHQDQQAVVVYDGGESGALGGAVPCEDVVPFLCAPNLIGESADFDPANNVRIYEAGIRRMTPESSSRFVPDAVDAEAFLSAWGHELGHATGMGHSADTVSIMRLTLIHIPPEPEPAIAHQFTASDLLQLRVK